MVVDMKELSESDNRLFRKKRRQVARRTNLKRLKNGVYLLPFENPRSPSSKEIYAFEQVEELMNDFDVKVSYFAASQVDVETLVIEGIDAYFVLSPIRVLENEKQDVAGQTTQTSEHSNKRTRVSAYREV
jgi:hypothetical protein